MGKSNRKASLETKIKYLQGERESLLIEIGRSERLIGMLPDRRERLWEVENLIRACEQIIKSDHPDWTGDHLKPAKAFSHKIPVPQGSASKLALEVLRLAREPMLVRDIAIEVLARVGIFGPSGEVIDKVGNTIGGSLSKRRGSVVDSDGEKPARWWVVRPS